MLRFLTLLLCLGLLVISENASAGSSNLEEFFDGMEVAKPEDLTKDKIMLPVGVTIAEFEEFEKRYPSYGASYNKAMCDFKDELLQHYRVGDLQLANTSIVSTQRQRRNHPKRELFTDAELTHEEFGEYQRNRKLSPMSRGKWKKSHMLANGLTVEEFDEYAEDSYESTHRGKRFGMNLCLFRDYLIWHYRNGTPRSEQSHWPHPNFN